MWIKWFPVQSLEYSFVRFFFITMEYKNTLEENILQSFLIQLFSYVFLYMYMYLNVAFKLTLPKSEFKANLSVCKIGIYFFAANADWLRNIFFLVNILVWAFPYIQYISSQHLSLWNFFRECSRQVWQDNCNMERDGQWWF